MNDQIIPLTQEELKIAKIETDQLLKSKSVIQKEKDDIKNHKEITPERRMGLYLLYDTIAEIHGPTFEAVNDQVAIRNIKNMKLPTPQDFILKRIAYRVGTGIMTDYKIIETGLEINE